MSSDDAAMSFIVDYEPSVDDLREQDIVGRLAAWRAKPLWSRLAYPVLSLLLVAVTAILYHTRTECFIPQSMPSQAPIQVWVWQCEPTMTPSGLLWENGWLFAVDGAVLVLTLIELVRAWIRPPGWMYRMLMKRQGLQGRYHYEVAADGLTAAGPDGIIAYVPWALFTVVRETRERFFLFGPRSKSVWVLPKQALADQPSVQQLGQFLRASVGREPPHPTTSK